MRWPYPGRARLTVLLLSALFAVACAQRVAGQVVRRSNEIALLLGTWVGDDLSRLGFYSDCAFSKR